MRIPHVVPFVIMQAYEPTPEELLVMDEGDIVKNPAANFQWDAAIIPKLRDLCIQQLSTMFEMVQPLTGILQQDVNTLVEVLPIDVDLKVTVPLIDYEIYWERCCRERWPSMVFIKRPDFGFWKKHYLTLYLEEYFEKSLPEEFDVNHSEDLAILLNEFITVLNIKQLQPTKCPPVPNCKDGIIRDECIRPDLDIPLDHIPLNRAFRNLQNLTKIRLVFCVKPMKENFDWRAFKFSLADCELICEGLSSLTDLKVLCINKCELDDIRAKIFFRFIGEKLSIEEIDFSNCYIGDEGMIALGGLLMEHTNLKVIRMRNNNFGDIGIIGLGHALSKGPVGPLDTLDIGMNFLTEIGACSLSSALIRCRTKPAELIISCCGFKDHSALLFSGMLALNRSIVKLDITANDFSGEAEAKFMDSLIKNRRLLEIDTRNSEISEEGCLKVRQLLERNKQFIGVDILQDDAVIPKLYLHDPEYLVWEFSPLNPEHEPGHYPPRIAED